MAARADGGVPAQYHAGFGVKVRQFWRTFTSSMLELYPTARHLEADAEYSLLLPYLAEALK
jgi:hypothetical protein